MTLQDIKEILNAEVLSQNENISLNTLEISRAYCADLMSDVLAYSIDNSLLITGLTNAQVVRTSEVANIKAIIFIQNKRPDIETIALADGKKIPLLVTDSSMFEACGRLYAEGLRSQSN